MKPLVKQNDLPVHSDDVVALLMDVLPRMFTALRAEFRRGRPKHLTVAQFRALAFIAHQEGCSLSDIAEHMGIALPTASKLIDGLVQPGLMTRKIAADDRRRAMFYLSAHGDEIFATVREEARVNIARQLATLPDGQQQILMDAMHILEQMFL